MRSSPFALPLVLTVLACSAPRAKAPPPSAPPPHASRQAPEREIAPVQAPAPAESAPWNWDPRPSDPERLAHLDEALRDELSTTWNIRSVCTTGAVLRVNTGMRTVDERVFRAILPMIACVYEQAGGVPRELERVEVANRFGIQGWILADAQLLSHLLALPVAEAERGVLAATLPLAH